MVKVHFTLEDLLICPGVYFTKGYGAATVVGAAPEWVNLAALDGQWQMPVILKPLETGGYEASSPYGYAGMHAGAQISSHSLSVLWGEAIEALRSRGVVSLFLRYAPFELGSVERSRGLDGLSLSHVSDTISVPTIDSASVWSGMQGRARTAVRKAERLGMMGAVEPAADENIVGGSPFRSLYEDTMHRVEAASHHFYPDAYYLMLREALRDRLQLVSVRNAEGGIVAAALLLVDDDVVHYHLSGSEPSEARNGANNLLIWTILQWSANHGYARAHLGGGTSAEDSLYKFKASFGGSILPFTVGKAIIDSARYGELVDSRAATLGANSELLTASGYFPAYRATVSSNAQG